ncbi:unnamed protein product [Victoria cruziana]
MSESSGFHELISTEEIEEYRSRQGRNGSTSSSSPSPSSRKVYVAVGSNVKEERYKLHWSLKSYQRATVVILHVHQPARMVPGPFGGKVHASKLKESELMAFRELERQEMMQAIDAYLSFFASKKVEAEHLIIESEDVGKGVVELVAQHEIGELVIGAAADKNFSKNMKSPTSKKAIYVNQHALPSCRIRFVCKGTHIGTREPYVAASSPTVPPCPTRCSPDSQGIRQRSPFSRWLGFLQSNCADTPLPEAVINRAEEVRRSLSLNSVGTTWSSCEGGPSLSPQSSSPMLSMERMGGEGCPSWEPDVDTPAAVDSSAPQTEDVEEQQVQCEDQQSVDMEAMLTRLRKVMEEAQASKKEAFQESQRRQQAEKEALDVLRQARIAELLSIKEQRLRKEAEAALSRERLELDKLVKQHKDAEEELRKMSVEKVSLERRITEMVHELEEKNRKLEDLLRTLDEKEREKLEMQRQMEDAMAKLPELSIRQGESGETTRMAHIYTEFSLAELVNATNGFDPGLKIGEGGFGTVYKGRIRYTTVAIKLLNSESMQGGSEFHQEVNVLSRLRHPHLVTLIGACTESCALVYEYLPNGSLEDRLSCKDGTPPLTWQVRTRIAAEICSALLFLHSASVVHGDLKPGNILLDTKLSAKIGDFGICRLLPEQDSTTAVCVTTSPKGTPTYMDPEYIANGRPPLWIARYVMKSVHAGNLQAIIDPKAGDWPYVQAVKLANLGLKCCNMSRRHRPDLETEVWKVLEPLRGSLAPSTYSTIPDSRQPPEYFICPICQEIMRDPQVAADGFTYEAEALQEWLDGGHDTSPMTNLKLSHLNLTPNHALRSAIQEWCSHTLRETKHDETFHGS